MKKEKQRIIEKLIEVIPALTEGQLFWLDKVIRVFKSPHKFNIVESDIFNKTSLDNFGDALRIHHSFSIEPFSKDKFECVLERVLNISGSQATLALKGNRGHDISINDCPVSLKTQADTNIRENKIWISKFMELGKGKWGDNPRDLVGLRKSFLEHLKSYDRILTLRTLERGPNWCYELVEIPKKLMESAKRGQLEMKKESKQFPKP